jgi:hypothetical protein
MKPETPRRGRRLSAVLALGLLLWPLFGCPRNQTTLDDRTLEQKPHVETERPVDRSDPWRP